MAVAGRVSHLRAVLDKQFCPSKNSLDSVNTASSDAAGFSSGLSQNRDPAELKQYTILTKAALKSVQAYAN